MTRFCVVDGHSQLFRAYHAVGYLSTSKGIPTQAVLVLSTMLWKLIREEQPDYLAVAWDAPGPTFRDALSAEYKAGRAAMPEDLVRQLPYVQRLLEALRIPVLEAAGFEADDILATLVDRALAVPDLEVLIVTGDKDLLQLVGPRVRVLSVSGRTGEPVLYDEARVRERWGVAPGQIVEVLALMGDAIDNIKGVHGVGEKTAVKLIAQFGSVERLYANLTLVPGKLRETLAAGRRDALLSRELAALNHAVPLSVDLDGFRRGEPDWARLRALWTELEFSRLLRELPAAAPAAEAGPVEVLADPAALAAWLARVPAGAPLAADWAGEARPPAPKLTGLAVFHPGPGAAALPPGAGAALTACPLVVHDAKPLLEAWLAAGVAPPSVVDDTAVAAYLLNPARSAYRLEELAAEAFGAGPPPRPEPAEPAPGPALGARARWVHRYWERAAAELRATELWRVYEEVERPLVPVLAAMERHGIRVDPLRLEAFAKELERSLDNLTREIWQLAGEEFTIASPRQLAQILFEKLKLPVLRRTKTGPSTDERVLTELALGHPLPAKILEHRSLAKLKGTYADTLPGLVDPATGRIHTTFNQLVAATGRLSSQDPNLMNIPIRTELGRRIRAAFIPQEGWRFVAADYSQIELRILAHLSGEPALIASFRRGEDIHARTASEVFRVPPGEVTALQRTIAKSANYAILYGVSAFGLSQATRIDQKEAQRYITDYFASHPYVRAFIDRTLAEGRARGYVTTLLGRRRYLPDLVSGNPVARNAAERMAMNAPVQGTASDMIKIAMVRAQAALAARGLAARMLLQVHDELLFEAPPAEAPAVEALAREVMEAALPLDVPVVVDVKAGKDWAEV
ncbi:MAG TPA: DNA polymerase I [Candidatus Rokubacteria bacterium]|nr:MAG: DNA polymerase I [Candidatus Rokubacteria bacterium GWA2_73_35]HBH00516.1 DNA polymerase I [Candidatus Rokubacteria bacterium]